MMLSNMSFMKDMEKRLQVYEFQTKMPIKKMEREIFDLRVKLKEKRLPMNEVIDLDCGILNLYFFPSKFDTIFRFFTWDTFKLIFFYTKPILHDDSIGKLIYCS